MMKRIVYLFLPAVLLPFLAFSQTLQRNCHTMDYLQEQINHDPSVHERMSHIEEHTQRVIQGQEVLRNTIEIPVVVHVVYNNSTENISDAQIQSQMQVLNDDFRRLNSDADNVWSQAADIEIQFCLASVDPNGNPTTGITRTFTSTSAFSTNDNMKFNSSGGKDAWPSSQYLNMWVCDISGGILGYAQFPGSGSAATDGVVMDYQYFGTIGTATAPFDLGRTTTHEVGHWLNLRHIWGDGPCGADDFVGDTPPSDAPNYGCAIGHVSCSTTDMVQNYMDYSDDACMNLFTSGQKDRMRALFNPGGFRASLLTSNGCGTPGGGGGSCSSTISSFPYSESFESGIGAWTQSSSDDIDWTRDNNGTPSGSTGPSSAADGSWYMYVEASSPNYPSKRAIFESPCFDLSGLSDPEFSFQYHMYGSNMGTLSLEASTDGSSWTSLWSLSGDQGNAWNSQTVSLSGYSGASELRLRFNGLTGNSFRSDMTIDNIALANASGGGGGCQDTEVTLTLVLDNYPSETSWSLVNSSGTTLASGNGYSTAGATVTETFCLTDGCYDFTINDSYGDGICCSYGNGSYNLSDGTTTLASGGSFTTSETTNFCVGSTPPPPPSCPTIDFNSYTINSYGGSQDQGSFQLMSSGTVLMIQNNAWKSISFPYTVTANTVIEFDFGSTTEGEIHGIGFDSDNGISSNRTFKVHGTQNWGITNYDNYSTLGSWTSYTIPVGSFYTGTFDRLFFVADHDGAPSNGNSYFRNIKVYEGSCGARTLAIERKNIQPEIGNEGEWEFSFYPNPASDFLNVTLPSSDEQMEVRVADMTGKILWANAFTSGEQTIDLSDLANGVYLLQVQIGEELRVEKFVKL